MLFKIRFVDVNGYCGREYHPEVSDIGQVVALLSVQTLIDSETDFKEASNQTSSELTKTDIQSLFDAEEKDEPAHYVEQCFFCVTRDGRFLELMPHEIERHQHVEPVAAGEVDPRD